MSEKDLNNNAETVEVEDIASKVAPSKGSKILFILASAVFASVVLYIMFFRKSAKEEKPADIGEIVVEETKTEPAREKGAEYKLDELVSEIPEETEPFLEEEEISEVPELPELPTLSQDVSKQLEQELKEELSKAEERRKEDYFTKEEVNKMIEERLKEFQGQQQKVPSSAERPILPLTATEEVGEKEKKLDLLKKSRVLGERQTSPIFKMKGGNGTVAKQEDVDSIIILDKDLLMDIEDTGGNILPTKTPDLSRAILQGKIIDAVLESSINTDVKAPVRAIISRDVYAEYGKNILIPRGSRLIGEYQAEIKRGQSRVTITWNRIIRVDGLSLNISASAVDNLGRGGVEGDVDNKYTEILGTAFLSTMLTIATAIAVEETTGSTGISTASTTSTGDTIQSSGKTSDYAIVEGTKDFMDKASKLVDEVAEQKPTIRIAQGTKIIVMVNQDLTLPLYKNRK